MKTLETNNYSIHSEDMERTIGSMSELADGRLPTIYPYQLQVNLTDRCNLFYPNGPKDCVGCSFPIKNDISVPIDGLIKNISQFASFQGQSVLITGGGEPGMYASWKDLLQEVAKRDLSLDVNTNGLVSIVYEKLVRNDALGASLLQKIYSRQRKVSTMSFSVHEQGAYTAIKRMNQIKRELDLNLRLRSTFLLHADTTQDEIDRFIENSANSGSDVIHFKPFHVFDPNSEKRRFIKNIPAYEYVNALCSNSQIELQIGALRLDRMHTDYLSIEEKMISDRKLNQFEDLAFDPVFTIFLDTNLRPAFNCDTKAVGIGGVKERLIDNHLTTPKDYFLQAILGIVTADTNNHLVGDNFTEMNQLILSNAKFSTLITFLKNLRTQFFAKKMSGQDISRILSAHFV
ncbi:hypothetical protein [Undibacterium sp. TS12]|uniref:hypothetical protein n=1 Tax=Undibacterium sp. TS12 TaxID=2908202 RepID=UPI001F4C6E10|nr:hypothetical protein [Undibacterium sp. TS12]MCH8618045.1 hypothetical protein [Undibacterium sp. TS12]